MELILEKNILKWFSIKCLIEDIKEIYDECLQISSMCEGYLTSSELCRLKIFWIINCVIRIMLTNLAMSVIITPIAIALMKDFGMSDLLTPFADIVSKYMMIRLL